jgi:hypothetical protein
MAVLGVKPIDRIAQKYNQPDMWQEAGNSLGYKGMKQITGAGFTRDEYLFTYMLSIVLLDGGRKMCPVPPKIPVIPVVEEMDLFRRS